MSDALDGINPGGYAFQGRHCFANVATMTRREKTPARIADDQRGHGTNLF
jgi:hypothetical protein